MGRARFCVLVRELSPAAPAYVLRVYVDVWKLPQRCTRGRTQWVQFPGGTVVVAVVLWPRALLGSLWWWRVIV